MAKQNQSKTNKQTTHVIIQIILIKDRRLEINSIVASHIAPTHEIERLSEGMLLVKFYGMAITDEALVLGFSFVYSPVNDSSRPIDLIKSSDWVVDESMGKLRHLSNHVNLGRLVSHARGQASCQSQNSQVIVLTSAIIGHFVVMDFKKVKDASGALTIKNFNYLIELDADADSSLEQYYYDYSARNFNLGSRLEYTKAPEKFETSFEFPFYANRAFVSSDGSKIGIIKQDLNEILIMERVFSHNSILDNFVS